MVISDLQLLSVHEKGRSRVHPEPLPLLSHRLDLTLVPAAIEARVELTHVEPDDFGHPLETRRRERADVLAALVGEERVVVFPELSLFLRAQRSLGRQRRLFADEREIAVLETDLAGCDVVLHELREQDLLELETGRALVIAPLDDEDRRVRITEHAPIARVHITVIPPRPSPALFKVFVHSRAAPGTLEIAPDGSRAVVRQAAIPETSFVEVRVLLDPALFGQAPLRRGETHESLLADERRQARREVLIHRAMVGGLVLSAGLMLGLVAAYLWTYLRYGREPQVPYDADYEREPPRDLPPAVVPAILPQRGVDRRLLPQGFAATLLEAVRLGYVEVEEHQDEGVLGTGLFRDTDLTYRLTPRGRALLGDRADEPGGRRGDARERDGRPGPQRERELEPFEVEVLRVVFRRAGNGQSVTDEQIEAWGRRMNGQKSNFLRFVERWGPQLRGWFEQRVFRLDDPTSERARRVFLTVTVLTTVVAVLVGFVISVLFALPVGIVVGVLAAVTLSRRTPEAALEVRRWGAFRRFLTDFSMLKEASARVLPLWERYLVYAAALGVAEEFLRTLTLVARATARPVGGPRWYTGGGGPGRLGAGTDGLASLTRLARSFQNLQSLSRALSSSTRSGGGFSGGGGGGGGGGSSRAG